MSQWEDYRKAYEDVQTYINDARLPGMDTGTTYKNRFGLDTAGWEQHWLNAANERFGRSAKDAGEFSEDELAQLNYENESSNKWGRLIDGKIVTGMGGRPLEGPAITQGQTSNKDDYFDVGKFDTLLNRLEGSKGRQQRQKSLESRRDIFAQGLAGMMDNF
jgi:hypothetical protein